MQVLCLCRLLTIQKYVNNYYLTVNLYKNRGLKYNIFFVQSEDFQELSKLHFEVYHTSYKLQQALVLQWYYCLKIYILSCARFMWWYVDAVVIMGGFTALLLLARQYHLLLYSPRHQAPLTLQLADASRQQQRENYAQQLSMKYTFSC